ncbi:hypothetical protein VUR80DRAFT_7389 [Thermomyces stellatus]
MPSHPPSGIGLTLTDAPLPLQRRIAGCPTHEDERSNSVVCLDLSRITTQAEGAMRAREGLDMTAPRLSCPCSRHVQIALPGPKQTTTRYSLICLTCEGHGVFVGSPRGRWRWGSHTGSLRPSRAVQPRQADSRRRQEPGLHTASPQTCRRNRGALFECYLHRDAFPGFFTYIDPRETGPTRSSPIGR